jgi:hypothetical protein
MLTSWTNKINTLLVLSCAFYGWSQSTLPQNGDTSLYKHSITVSSAADYSGSAMKREFSNILLRGGVVDNNLKNNVFALHNGRNLFGLDLHSELEYRNYEVNLFKNENIGLSAIGGVYNYLSAAYSKDAFGLIFYGNQQYQGDTASFGGTELNFVNFQKLGLGVFNKKSKSSASINFYNIGSYTSLFIRNSSIETSENGDQVDIVADAKYESSYGSDASKGYGLGIDFEYRLPVEWLNEKTAYFSVAVKNLGVMSINKIDRYDVRNEVSLSGFSFSELFQSDRLNMDAIADSIGVVKSSNPKVTMLPGFIQVGKMTSPYFEGKIQSFFGVRLYTTLNYNPLAYLGFQYEIKENFKAALQTSFGGFTGFRVGSYLQYEFSKVFLAAGCEDLVGTISKSGYGQSIHLKCMYRW